MTTRLLSASVILICSSARKEAEKQLRVAGIELAELDVIASIDNQETIKKAVREGMGITILSKLAAEDASDTLAC